MSDFNATFAPRTTRKCAVRDIINNVSTLCVEVEHHHDVRHLQKDVRKRAKRTNTAGSGCHDHRSRHRRNVLTSGHCR